MAVGHDSPQFENDMSTKVVNPLLASGIPLVLLVFHSGMTFGSDGMPAIPSTNWQIAWCQPSSHNRTKYHYRSVCLLEPGSWSS